MDHFRECFDRQVAATDELLRNFLTGPAPKEEKMATDFRTKTCGQCAYFGDDSYTGTHCRRTALKMTSGEIPACPSFVAALEGE